MADYINLLGTPWNLEVTSEKKVYKIKVGINTNLPEGLDLRYKNMLARPGQQPIVSQKHLDAHRQNVNKPKSSSPVPQPNKKKLLSDIMTSGAWKNQRCFIIGGGTSVSQLEISKLKSEKIIALNRSFETCMFAPIMHSCDSRFYRWIQASKLGPENQALYNQYKGLKTWLDTHDYPFGPEVYTIPYLGPHGLSLDLSKGIFGGNCSGFSGLSLALALGANPIYLLGYDFYVEPEKTHHHAGYPLANLNENVLLDYVKQFEIVANTYKKEGFKIFNTNEKSRLRCFDFIDYNKLEFNIPNKFIVVSYFTEATIYEENVKNLIESLNRFGIDYDIKKILSGNYAPLNDPSTVRKNWRINSYYKAAFIREMMDKHRGKDIVWIDADAVVQTYPILFTKLTDCDLAAHYRNGTELLSGTLFVKNTDRGRFVFDRWIEKNNEKLNTSECNEQTNLQEVVNAFPDIKVYKLPPEYTKIFDLMKGINESVIEHYQTSRMTRKGMIMHLPTNTTKGEPKVSIVMPTFNQSKYIKESIRSVLDQSFRDFELIIVNDGSTDETKNIIDNIRDSRIKIIHKENGGTGSALNVGFSVCKGEYETWIASDNKYYTQALREMVMFLDTHPEIDFVYTCCEIGVMDETGLIEKRRKNYNEEVNMEWNPHKFFERYNIGVIWLWRKHARINVGDWQLTPCEDHDMFCRMVLNGVRFAYLPKVCGWHRRHPFNLSAKLQREGMKYVHEMTSKLIQMRDAKNA